MTRQDPAVRQSLIDSLMAALAAGTEGFVDEALLIVRGRQAFAASYSREASIPTHAGSCAIAGAAATAAAVSAAVDGAPAHEVLRFAEEAAACAEARWPCSRGPVFAKAVRSMVEDFRQWPDFRAERIAVRYFPDRPLTIVPLALGLASVLQSAESAILLATNVGGDSDSVASIAGGILGAMHPGGVNGQWYDVVETVNGHDLIALAGTLSRLRH